MAIELSVEATDFLKTLLSQLTCNPAAKDAEKTVRLVKEILEKL